MGNVVLGKLVEAGAVRDAVHVAVAPVVAKEKLAPGQPVGLDGTTAKPVGIVDPYLTAMVFPGQEFYLCLFPGTPISLRHDWQHPDEVTPEQVVAGEPVKKWKYPEYETDDWDEADRERCRQEGCS